ncbi:Protein angel 2 [Linnemannia zychae]|nr:Protein angel 2 [Linnemannia zychae]
MTYNVLSNDLSLSNKHLYVNCKKADLQWKTRSKRLLQELRSQMLDIYCLQEIDKGDYTGLFQPAFREWGYSSVVKAVKLEGVNYDENTFSRKENVGIVGIFDIKSRGLTRRICLATSHIIFHPTYGMTKIAQLRMLLDKSRKMIIEQNADVPIESVDVTAIPEWRLSGQVAHAPCKFNPPYENKIGAFLKAFPDDDRVLSPTSKVITEESPLSEPSLRTSATITMDAAKIVLPEPSALLWSASSLRSLIRKSKKEWEFESTDSTSNVVTANSVTFKSSDESLGSTRTHTVFSESGISTTKIVSKIHTPKPSTGVICQPFSLTSAYPFMIAEESARMNGSNRSLRGGPWTTFHSRAKVVCDYIFYGQLRAPVADPSTSASNSTTCSTQKLQVDGILELPCSELDQDGIVTLPTEKYPSDHLSLATRFKFV